MGDRDFAIEMRRALLLIAEGATDPVVRRGMLQVVATIEKRYRIPKLRIVQEKKAIG